MSEASRGGIGKWIVWLLLLALAGGGFYAWRQHHHPQTMGFNSAPVVRGDLTQVVTATGSLNPVVAVQVGCQVSGTILTNYVDFNSQVHAGQLIARIDPRSYQAQVEQAAADLANTAASLELQQIQARRAGELFTNHLISAADNDTAVAALHQAEAQIKLKQAALDTARANLDYTKIYSPVDGIVIVRAVDIGQTVAASFSTPMLFQIADDLTRMEIDSNVAEADIGGVLEGQSVDFTVDAYPYRTFHGVVRQVRNQPLATNNVVSYDTVISVTNADNKLKPGMTANVSIIVAEHSGVLKIPNAALRFRPPEDAIGTNSVVATATNSTPSAARARSVRNLRTVYVLSGDPSVPNLQPVQIKTGISDGIFTEVLEGPLKEGDKLATGILTTDAAGSGSASPFSGGGFPRMR